MGTHLRVLDESYPISTNMTGVYMVFKPFCIFSAMHESSFRIERVNTSLAF